MVAAVAEAGGAADAEEGGARAGLGGWHRPASRVPPAAAVGARSTEAVSDRTARPGEAPVLLETPSSAETVPSDSDVSAEVEGSHAAEAAEGFRNINETLSRLEANAERFEASLEFLGFVTTLDESKSQFGVCGK